MSGFGVVGATAGTVDGAGTIAKHIEDLKQNPSDPVAYAQVTADFQNTMAAVTALVPGVGGSTAFTALSADINLMLQRLLHGDAPTASDALAAFGNIATLAGQVVEALGAVSGFVPAFLGGEVIDAFGAFLGLAAVGVDIGDIRESLAMMAEALGNKDGGTLGAKLSTDLGNAQKQVIDPLVVSMDGNAITTTSLANGNFVDYQGTGFEEQSSWFSANAGILVDVTNPNGTLNNGFTMIGTEATNQNGNLQGQAGFTQLAAFDTNHDGVINASDTDFNQIEIWVGSNGQAGSGSLEALAQAGISAISLSTKAVNTVDANGDQLTATSSITYSNGTTGTLADMNMAVDTSNTIDERAGTTNTAYANLPNVTGWGEVHSLQVAMALDTSGNLASLVQQYLAATPAVQATLINNLIFTWTGVENNPQETTYHFTGDSREIDALSKFVGAQYSNTSGWSTTLVTAGANVKTGV